MSWLKNLSLGLKITLSFAALLILVMAFGIWSYQFSNRVYHSSAQVLEKSQPFAQLAGDMGRDVIQIQQWLTDISATRAQDGLDDGFAEAEASYKSFLKGLNRFEARYREERGAADLQAVEKIRTQVANYYEVGKRMAQAYIDHGPVGGNKMMANFDEAAEALVAELEPFLEQQNTELHTELLGLQAMSGTLQAGIVTICLVVVLLVAVVAWLLTRSITKPVGEAVQMIEEIERGHLGRRVQSESKDEIGRMVNTLNRFADNLQNEVIANLTKLASGNLDFNVAPRDEQDEIRGALKKLGNDLNMIVAQIQISGDQIASGSEQVSDSSQSLSQGATEQASSLEEITSSMAEMGAQTKQNAENATQANLLSAEAKGAAEKGNEQMQAMVTAMDEINEAGQSISKIIKVIDEIAFQTNLLALNAAVEAARAGKHGKGFAVVAEEVRNLAARSAKAASETADLIEGSVKKAEAGAEIADKTAEALGEIVHGVTKVTDLVGEIAAASSEQAQGISQVSQGLGQIDQVTQQNTANAEESAAASEELSSQASHLRQMLTRFKLKSRTDTLEAQEVNTVASIGLAEEQSPPSPFITGPGSVIALDDNEFGKY